MNIKDQVVNLKLSQELKKNGYKQEGLWWWSKGVDWNESSLYHHSDLFKSKSSQDAISSMEYPSIQFVSPTGAELGERLKHPNQELLSYHPNSLPVWTGTSWALYRNGKVVLEADTEANARAKTWIYLNKKGLI